MERDSARVAVVAGGGYAGVLAANRLRGRLDGRTRVILLTPGKHLTDRVRLHEAAARGRNVRTPYSRLLARGVEHVSGQLVGLDARARRLALDADGGNQWLSYDALILALGSRLHSIIPSTSEHALALADPERAQRLAAALRELAPGERIAIVGGGLTSIELSAEIAEAHPALRVELIASEFVPDLAGPARDALRAALERAGVSVREGVAAAELTPQGVLLRDGRQIAARISVLAAGFSAAPLLPELGLPRRADGRIPVDELLRVDGYASIFVAGDLAAPPSAAIGSGLAGTRMACATALPLGAHAADQVARLWSGAPLKPFRFSYVARCISIGRRSGVLVFVDADDRPTGRVLRGRGAALVKEAICRLVLEALRIERIFAGAFSWPGARSRRVTPEPEPARLRAS